MNISPGEPRMSPTAFVAKWRDIDFGEKQASQEMFLDICAVLGHPTPVDYGDTEHASQRRRRSRCAWTPTWSTSSEPAR